MSKFRKLVVRHCVKEIKSTTLIFRKKLNFFSMQLKVELKNETNKLYLNLKVLTKSTILSYEIILFTNRKKFFVFG